MLTHYHNHNNKHVSHIDSMQENIFESEEEVMPSLVGEIFPTIFLFLLNADKWRDAVYTIPHLFLLESCEAKYCNISLEQPF